MRQIVISIETTGPEVSNGHRVIEIGCVELIDEKLSGRHYHQYLNPERHVDESAIERHGITDEFLSDKPRFSDIAEEFLDFLGSDELVTYNAGYVLAFLHHEIKLLGSRFKGALNNDFTDVLDIGNKRHPKQNNSLYNLCDRYYVDTSQSGLSGALFRAEIIADLLLALINESTKKITSDLSRYEVGETLVVAETFSDFDNAIEGISKTALCRGVSNHEYPLLPSLFRRRPPAFSSTRL